MQVDSKSISFPTSKVEVFESLLKEIVDSKILFSEFMSIFKFLILGSRHWTISGYGVPSQSGNIVLSLCGLK